MVTNTPEPCGSRADVGADSLTALATAVGRPKSGQKVRLQKELVRRASQLPQAVVRMSAPTAPHV